MKKYEFFYKKTNVFPVYFTVIKKELTTYLHQPWESAIILLNSL